MKLPLSAHRSPVDVDSEALAKGSRSRYGRWIARLAGLSDTPRRTAAAFALGVFLSFSPFLGFQIAIGVVTALAFRLNRLAVLIGLCANLPWLMVPWYALTTAAGAAMLGVAVGGDFPERMRAALELSVLSREFWARLIDLLWPFLGSFLLGSTAGAALVGVSAYFVTARIMTKRHAARQQQPHCP